MTSRRGRRHGRRSVDGGVGKVGAARIARAASFAKNGETDGAHEADADWTLVTETRRAKIDAARGGEFEEFSTAKVETGGGEKVLEESVAARGLDVGAAGDVRGLLEKRRVVFAEGEGVDGNGLTLRAEDGVHHGDVIGGVVLRALKTEHARSDA